MSNKETSGAVICSTSYIFYDKVEFGSCVDCLLATFVSLIGVSLQMIIQPLISTYLLAVNTHYIFMFNLSYRNSSGEAFLTTVCPTYIFIPIISTIEFIFLFSFVLCMVIRICGKKLLFTNLRCPYTLKSNDEIYECTMCKVNVHRNALVISYVLTIGSSSTEKDYDRGIQTTTNASSAYSEDFISCVSCAFLMSLYKSSFGFLKSIGWAMNCFNMEVPNWIGKIGRPSCFCFYTTVFYPGVCVFIQLFVLSFIGVILTPQYDHLAVALIMIVVYGMFCWMLGRVFENFQLISWLLLFVVLFPFYIVLKFAGKEKRTARSV